MVKLALFLSSYAALFAILGLRWIGHHTILGSGCFTLAILGLLLTWYGMSAARGQASRPLRVFSVRDAGAEVSGYLATYLLPFVTVSDPNAADLLAYVLFLLIAALIFVRTTMIQVNPTLYLVGYRVFQINCEPIAPPTRGAVAHIEGYLITRGKPPMVGDTPLLRTLRDTVLVPN
jgi:hypothetical protein